MTTKEPKKPKSDIELSFGPSFQDQLLALMTRDMLFASNVIKNITEDKLYSEAHKWFFGKIKKKFEKTSSLISYVEIEDEAKLIEKSKRRLLLNFAKKIFSTKIEDEEFLKIKLTEHVRKISFVDMFMTAQTIWNEGKHADAYDYTKKEVESLHSINFTNESSISLSNFSEKRRMMVGSERFQHIPTGITPLDEILRGGLEKGEFGILLAEPKKGKSIGLLHMGCAAVYTYARVAHFVLEGTTEQAMARYLSRLSGIEYDRIVKEELTLEESIKINKLEKRYGPFLELIPFNQHWNYTVLDVEAKLKELRSIGKNPDLVVIDYADLLKANSSLKEKRHEQTEIYRDLKRLAVMHKYAIWTASQATRPKDEPENEYLLRAKDISEAFEKVRIADLVATLNQTPREKENGILRFHLDIYRSNDFDSTLKIITNFEKMIFYSKLLGHFGSSDHHAWMEKKRKGRR